MSFSAGVWAVLLASGLGASARAAVPPPWAWSVSIDQLNAYFGAATSTAGDINGDGFSDVIVAAPSYDDGQTDEGRVYVYAGSPSGLSASELQILEGEGEFLYFGGSIATAGDVNADGYSDVIIGTPYYTDGEEQEGRAQVFLGSPAGLVEDPIWSVESNIEAASFGAAVSLAGDVNGDGYDDVIVGAYGIDGYSGKAFVYHGGSTGLSTTPSWVGVIDDPDSQFGQAVASAGDVNGDGYDDVIVGAPYLDAGQDSEGRVYVYHGGPSGLSSTPAWVKESNLTLTLFGYSVQGAGDTDGDGYGDVLIGSPAYSDGQSNEGRVQLFRGSATGLRTTHSWAIESNQAVAYMGYSVSTAGDFNGDGFADVIIGAPEYDSPTQDEGVAFVHLGSPAGPDLMFALSAESNKEEGQVGLSVMTAGDVNGDGFSDCLVGSPYFVDGESHGLARVYHGQGASISPTPRLSNIAGTAGDAFGQAVAPAGDVNGDGYGDFIIGSPGYSNGQSDEGAAFVYHSEPDDASIGATLESGQTGAGLGTSVDCAGDVNGDGYDDVIVGAPLYDNGQSEEGRAFVYHGSPTGISTTAAWTAESNQPQANFGWSVARAGDVNGDGYGDVIVGAYRYTNGQDSEGRAFVYHGSPTGLLTTASWTAESNQAVASFGWSVACAGDVNGDGFSDVIVGANLYDNGQSNEGRAFVYLGSASGLSSSPAWTAESNQNFADFGVAVASAGDVNGDGFSDVIVGADGYDGPEFDEGRAYVYHGSSTGLGASPAWTKEPNANFWQFALAVASAGDVNGDGFSDVVIGSPWATQGESNEGLVHVYHGSSSGLEALAAVTLQRNRASELFGYSVATAGDVNGDGFSDVLLGCPTFQSGAGAVGAWFVHLGNKHLPGSFTHIYNAGLDRIARQTRAGDEAPIALLGKSDYQDAFRLQAKGRTAAGRGKVALEWEVKPRGVAFDGTNLARGVVPVDTGSPSGFLGSAAPLSEVVGGLQNGMAYRWRARIVSDSPYFPRTRWLSMARNAMSEVDFRSAGPLLDAVPGAGDPAAPMVFLEAVHPQPFTAGHTLSFSLPVAGDARLALYDAQGRERAVLVQSFLEAGSHAVPWDGRDRTGSMLPAGAYFLRLEAGARSEARKLVWMP